MLGAIDGAARQQPSSRLAVQQLTAGEHGVAAVLAPCSSVISAASELAAAAGARLRSCEAPAGEPWTANSHTRRTHADARAHTRRTPAEAREHADTRAR